MHRRLGQLPPSLANRLGPRLDHTGHTDNPKAEIIQQDVNPEDVRNNEVHNRNVHNAVVCDDGHDIDVHNEEKIPKNRVLRQHSSSSSPTYSPLRCESSQDKRLDFGPITDDRTSPIIKINRRKKHTRTPSPNWLEPDSMHSHCSSNMRSYGSPFTERRSRSCSPKRYRRMPRFSRSHSRAMSPRTERRSRKTSPRSIVDSRRSRERSPRMEIYPRHSQERSPRMEVYSRLGQERSPRMKVYPRHSRERSPRMEVYPRHSREMSPRMDVYSRHSRERSPRMKVDPRHSRVRSPQMEVYPRHSRERSPRIAGHSQHSRSPSPQMKIYPQRNQDGSSRARVSRPRSCDSTHRSRDWSPLKSVLRLRRDRSSSSRNRRAGRDSRSPKSSKYECFRRDRENLVKEMAKLKVRTKIKH